jgi:hypothetical protein
VYYETFSQAWRQSFQAIGVIVLMIICALALYDRSIPQEQLNPPWILKGIMGSLGVLLIAFRVIGKKYEK